MKKKLLQSIDPHWREVFTKYISKGQKQRALWLLDKLIAHEFTLFDHLPEFQKERKVALLLRIELLRQWNRDLEALAWLCLECELHPENKLANLLKDELRFNMGLDKPSSKKEKLFTNYISAEQDDWHGVAGMLETKTILMNEVIKPLKNPEIFNKYKISPPNGILLYGPPGCGKTFIARKLSEKLNFNFYEIKPSDLASIYVHGSQVKISALFNKASENAPSIIFFDEFDALVPKRGDTSHHYKSEVNEFLAQLDNLSEKGIILIAATNLISSIDASILRPGRIDIKVFIPPPDFEARLQVIKLYLEDRPQEKIDFMRLAEYLEYYTYSEIKNIIDITARKSALNQDPITTDRIIDVILENPASLTDEEIEKYKS
jgi:transitional endoplasmic reticulum ATPase